VGLEEAFGAAGGFQWSLRCHFTSLMEWSIRLEAIHVI
jgi:hypothetical protein